MFIYPYKMGSKSVAALAAALEARVIRLENSKFRGNSDKLVINWGNSVTNEEIEAANVLNKPACVALATNKLHFFQTVADVLSIPEYTTDRTVAETWLDAGKRVVVREKLSGHSGDGIVLIEDTITWDSYDHSRAKMYVLYVPKKDEYRVHVVAGEVIDVQRKAIHPEVNKASVNFQIRNHRNGFIYVREGVRENCPPMVMEQALLAVELTNLHFGAVDVIWNEHRNKAFVLEVNTAPGLEGTSVDNYTKAFRKYAAGGISLAEIVQEYVPLVEAPRAVRRDSHGDIVYENNEVVPQPVAPPRPNITWQELLEANPRAAIALQARGGRDVAAE